MLQIVLGVIIGVLVTLGLGWFVRKYKDQIQVILSKYLYWILGLCFPLLTGLLIGVLVSNKGEELGSWADWASAIGTVGAFIWGIVAITKQTNIQRALNVENKRPRFSFEQTLIIQEGEIVLRPDMGKNTTPDRIKERLNNNEGTLFRIANISANPIYSLKIILYHKDKKFNRRDTYVFHGMPQESAIVLVPTEFIKKWQAVFIKFRSSANEVGYMYCVATKSTHYYFVKDKNIAISKYSDDKLISPNDKVAREFEKVFKYSSPSRVMFKANKVIKKVDNKKDK